MSVAPWADAPSPESVRVAGRLARHFRPRADRWSPKGYQLRILRWAADGYGLLSRPRHTRVERAQLGSMRGSWIVARGVLSDGRAVLLLHGGGYVLGSDRSHRGLAANLSAASRTPVLIPAYRRAPEHPFPAAADDALLAYQSLLDAGFRGEQVALAGDSVGGHLAACLLSDMGRLGLPMPAAVVLMSPALDLTGEAATARDQEQRDPILSPAYGRQCLSAYLGKTAPTDPRLDVFAGTMRTWPPTLIQVGDTECLLADAQRLAALLEAAGVPHELQVWPGQVHVFQALARHLPEARSAIGYAGEFLYGRLQGGRPDQQSGEHDAQTANTV